MTDIAIVASRHDAQFGNAVRAGLQASPQNDVSLYDSLPDSAAGSFVVLIWSAALEAAHAIDVQALIGLWSEGRLLVVRRDATPLPLGMRDLASLSPDKTPSEICAVVSEATEDDAASLMGRTPAVLQSKPEERRHDIPAFSRKETRASPLPQAQKKGSLVTKFVAVLLIATFTAGGWYWYTAGERSKVAALTAALEVATKATEELSRAKRAELEAQKRAAEARAAEQAAAKSGDVAALNAATNVRLKAEADAAGMAELMRRREGNVKAMQDSAKKAKDDVDKRAVATKAEHKAEVAAVAPKAESPPVEAPRAEPKVESVAKPVPEAPKAEAPKPAAPRAMSRSERERLSDEEAARKALAAAGSAPQVAAASPAVSVPAPAAMGAAAEVLYQQALAMENEGRAAESVRIYRRAARAGSGKAAKRLGDIFDKGVPGIPRDYAESLQWYETARQLGETVETARARGGDWPSAEPGRPQVAAEKPARAPKPLEPQTPEPVKSEPVPIPTPPAPEAREVAKSAPASKAPAPEMRETAKSVPKPVPAPAAPADVKADVDAEELLVQALGAQNAGRNEEALRLFKQAAAGSGIAAGLAAKRLGEVYDKGLLGVERSYADSLQYYEIARKNGVISAARGGGSVEESRREREVAERVERVVAERYGSARAPQPRPTAEETAAAAAKAAAQGRSEMAYAVLVFALVLGLGILLWRRYGTQKDPQHVRPVAIARQAQGDSLADSTAMLFVSYSHKDKKRVEPIVSLMEGMGRRVWMDRTDITGQAGWAGQIVRAIRECRAVVLMASPNSYSSDQVVRELYLAMNHKKTIVPIEIEPAALPDELQYILAPFQHHRLSGRETREVLGRALAAV